MGTWNARLFSNDTTCDVKDTYMEYLKKQLSDEEVFQKTYEEYEELIGTDEEPLFWYAMADTQWNVGRLMLDVRDKAMKYIQKEGGIELWEEVSGGAAKWRSTLQKLEDKLNTPMPPRKRIPKPIEFVRNPWNIGDVYAYQFHTKKAEEHGMYGKYILFQKVGDVEYYENNVYSVVQVFDCVFDNVPTLDAVQDIRVLPLVPAGIDENVEKEDIIPFLLEIVYYLHAQR